MEGTVQIQNHVCDKEYDTDVEEEQYSDYHIEIHALEIPTQALFIKKKAMLHHFISGNVTIQFTVIS